VKDDHVTLVTFSLDRNAGHEYAGLSHASSWSAPYAWSPDSRLIAFSSEAGDACLVRIIDVITTNEIVVSRSCLGQPSWSGDSRYVAFDRSLGDPTSTAVSIYDTRSRRSQQLTGPVAGWTRNAHEIALLRAGSIDLVDVAGGSTRSVPTECTAEFQWSRDGSTLLCQAESGIWRIRPDVPAADLIAAGDASGARWSLEADLVLFDRYPGAGAGGAPSELWVMRPDGSQARRIASGLGEARWSPSGEFIVALRPTDLHDGAFSKADVVLLRPDGSQVRVLARNIYSITW
jgi:Tol biopolymer transport system component